MESIWKALKNPSIFLKIKMFPKKRLPLNKMASCIKKNRTEIISINIIQINGQTDWYHFTNDPSFLQIWNIRIFLLEHLEKPVQKTPISFIIIIEINIYGWRYVTKENFVTEIIMITIIGINEQFPRCIGMAHNEFFFDSTLKRQLST